MRGKNKKNEKVNKVEKAVKKVTDPIEKVGKELRTLMSWIDNKEEVEVTVNIKGILEQQKEKVTK